MSGDVEFHLTGCPASGGGDGDCRCRMPRARKRRRAAPTPEASTAQSVFTDEQIRARFAHRDLSDSEVRAVQDLLAVVSSAVPAREASSAPGEPAADRRMPPRDTSPDAIARLDAAADAGAVELMTAALTIIVKLKAAIEVACHIIEIGDQRLLASDGPAGGQPPALSLAEWRKLYKTLDDARRAR